MATSDRASGADRGSSPPVLAWIVPVLAFLAGCLLSGIAVALIMSDDGEEDLAGAAPPPVAASPAPEPAAAPSPELVVRVPQSCLDAAASAVQVGEETENLVEAVRDLDARRLQELVDRFQQNQPGLQQAAQRCRQATDERIEDGVTETPAPTPTG